MHHRRRPARIDHLKFTPRERIIGAAAVADIITSRPEGSGMIVAGIRVAGTADIGPRLRSPLRTYRAPFAVGCQLRCSVASERQNFFGSLAAPFGKISR